MISTSDAYRQVHLILSRLNSEWSISGTVLSPHAQYLLRRELDDRDMVGSTKNLIDAWTHISTAAGEWVDESSSPLDIYSDAHRIQRWNIILAGASEQLVNDLIPALDDESESLHRYIAESFNKAQSLKQVMG
jgi:hypothetical protein